MRTLSLLASLAVCSAVHAALAPVQGFKGLGLKGRTMYIHQSSATIPTGAPIVLMIHPCLLGVRPWYSSTTEIQKYADEIGVHLIYPSTTNDNSCWDVSTKQTLLHDGGSDSKNIALMIDYWTKEKKADKNRVYAIGSSSGAMMTNVLMATYPDVLKAGASFSGVAAGCLAQSTCAASGCSSPSSDKSGCTKSATAGARSARPAEIQNRSPKAWGDIVRNAYPGYTGARPKVMIWHGTSDSIVSLPNLNDALKQWSDVHGVQLAKNVSDTPKPGYTKMIYGDGTKLVGYSARGVGHTVPAGDKANFKEVFEFFGLDKASVKAAGKDAAKGKLSEPKADASVSQGAASELKGATSETKGAKPEDASAAAVA